ncbi:MULTISPECIES: lipo-like protein [unclassified Roseitalea]|uniref:lipo-like protein n=1 Tax=unclassified Roseitalea TaxID=2639107 RepID=UPI00273D5C68|nr:MULTISPECIES: lipo-like protein [unclassified Roseitalea]
MTEQRDTMLDRIGRWLAERLETESSGYQPYTPSDPATLYRMLRPGDVLLVEGNRRISAAIKYLTQSTWSHSALYVGDVMDEDDGNGRRKRLVEVNLGTGCIAVPIEKYATYNTRICRPVGLTPTDRHTVVEFMIDRIGLRYDNKNIIDMARYFLPAPPVPVRWRRRMIEFGSGDPTRAICSTLIAEAFQHIRYPILPEITLAPGRARAASDYSRREILHIRHHSLYTPRDFDLSPYFEVVKPTLAFGFDYKRLNWHEPDAGKGPPVPPAEPLAVEG